MYENAFAIFAINLTFTANQTRFNANRYIDSRLKKHRTKCLNISLSFHRFAYFLRHLYLNELVFHLIGLYKPPSFIGVLVSCVQYALYSKKYGIVVAPLNVPFVDSLPCRMFSLCVPCGAALP